MGYARAFKAKKIGLAGANLLLFFLLLFSLSLSPSSSFLPLLSLTALHWSELLLHITQFYMGPCCSWDVGLLFMDLIAISPHCNTYCFVLNLDIIFERPKKSAWRGPFFPAGGLFFSFSLSLSFFSSLFFFPLFFPPFVFS